VSDLPVGSSACSWESFNISALPSEVTRSDTPDESSDWVVREGPADGWVSSTE